MKKTKSYNSFKISIGDITIGGTGKTPVTMAIANYLKINQHNVAIIYKQYLVKNPEDVAIPHKYGNIYKYHNVGDEPILLSNFTDVFIVKDRYSIEFNLDKYDYLLFDGGFFDNSIGFNKRIFVIDCNYFLGNKMCLPSGPLRIPLSIGLKMADKLILTDYQDDRDQGKYLFLQKFKAKEDILIARLKVTSNHDKKKIYLAYAGIGNNQKFFDTLKKNNVNIIETMHFQDHHLYTINDIEQIISIAKARELTIITKEKDYIKLPEKYKPHVECFTIEYDIEDINSIFIR